MCVCVCVCVCMCGRSIDRWGEFSFPRFALIESIISGIVIPGLSKGFEKPPATDDPKKKDKQEEKAMQEEDLRQAQRDDTPYGWWTEWVNKLPTGPSPR